ncbi:MAG TPA: neutral zinc metallopeptidase, partial [Bacteroidia bacterium]|nr:neutral zinc metallopeptidase [Bacteroidia bacterium]
MDWKGRQASTNVEDRRGGGGGGFRGRGGRGFKTVGGLGLGGIIIAVVVMFLGGDPSQVMNSTSGNSGGSVSDNTNAPGKGRSAKEDEDAEFVKVVLKDTEDAWHKIFREQLGREYEEPILVLFTDEVESACGEATASTGPFYCSGDQRLYIDLSFYDDLKNEFEAPGDFAMAYVVAHEVGHHVQYLLGKSTWVHQQEDRLSEVEFNKLSVKLELQADFYAGVWAHYAEKMKDVLDNGDIEEALNAANAIG